MKKILSATLFTAALACSAAAAGPNLNVRFPDKPSPDQKALQALLQEMVATAGKGDVDALIKYYDPQAVIVSRHGVSQGTDQFRSRLQAELSQMRAAAQGLSGGTVPAHSADQFLINTDGSFAWVTYSYTISADVDGQARELWGIGTMTLRKKLGVWRIVQSQANAKPKEAWSK